jgi:hypothetical protein
MLKLSTELKTTADGYKIYLRRGISDNNSWTSRFGGPATRAPRGTATFIHADLQPRDPHIHDDLVAISFTWNDQNFRLYNVYLNPDLYTHEYRLTELKTQIETDQVQFPTHQKIIVGDLNMDYGQAQALQSDLDGITDSWWNLLNRPNVATFNKRNRNTGITERLLDYALATTLPDTKIKCTVEDPSSSLELTPNILPCFYQSQPIVADNNSENKDCKTTRPLPHNSHMPRIPNYRLATNNSSLYPGSDITEHDLKRISKRSLRRTILANADKIRVSELWNTVLTDMTNPLISTNPDQQQRILQRAIWSQLSQLMVEDPPKKPKVWGLARLQSAHSKARKWKHILDDHPWIKLGPHSLRTHGD